MMIKPYLSAIYMFLKSQVITAKALSPINKKNSIYSFRRKNRKSRSRGGTIFSGKKIIFAPIYSFPDRVNAYEAMLADTFHDNGADVVMVSCNKGLPACAWNTNASKKLSLITDRPVLEPTIIASAKCSYCKNKFNRLYGNHKDVRLLQLTDYNSDISFSERLQKINGVDLKKQNYIYKGINIFEHAKASTLRVLLVGSINFDDENHVQLLKRFLVSSLEYVDIMEKVFKAEKPDVVCCVHGIYMEHGILVDLCKRENLRIVISGIPYKKKSMWFAVGDTYHRTITYDKDFSWQKRPLKPSQYKKVREYIESKITGGRDNIIFHPNPNTNHNSILKELGLRKDQKIVSIFTNTLWDAQINYKENAFKDMMHWLEETIKLANYCPSRNYVIRVHPAEAKIGLSTNQPVIEEVKKIFKDLPSNVILVGPESDISSVDLALLSDFCVVYGSKIAVELASKGKLVIVAGESICRNKGFTLDIKSGKHYTDTFKNIDKILETYDYNNSVDMAFKWAYHLFFEIMVYFPWASADIVLGRKGIEIYHPTDEKDKRKLISLADSILRDEKIIQIEN